MYSIPVRRIVVASVVTLSWVQPASAAQPPSEDSQVVTRTVDVPRDALLGDSKALAHLNHELNRAAKSVCDELYPLALIYLSHQCVSETLDDARDQLNRIRAVRSASNGAPRILATVEVRAR